MSAWEWTKEIGLSVAIFLTAFIGTFDMVMAWDALWAGSWNSLGYLLVGSYLWAWSVWTARKQWKRFISPDETF